MAHSMTVMHQASERGDVTSKDWRAGRRRGGRVWIFVALAIAVLAVAAGALLAARHGTGITCCRDRSDGAAAGPGGDCRTRRGPADDPIRFR